MTGPLGSVPCGAEAGQQGMASSSPPTDSSGESPSSEPTRTAPPPQRLTKKKKRRNRRGPIINTTNCKYDIVREVAEGLGWEEDEDVEGEAGNFNVFWTDTSVLLARVGRLKNFHRINHFPSMHVICRKNHLCTTLGKMRKAFPKHYCFFPRTWTLKAQANEFRLHLKTPKAAAKAYIFKPNAGCQGKGIVVTRRPLDLLDEVEESVVQEYISNPLLIEGKKFDMRVYVLVTSVRHLSMFIYDEGLVRLCTEDYARPDQDNVDEQRVHLTNYAVNKNSEKFFVPDDDSSCDVGSKRDFAFLNRHLAALGVDVARVWSRIESLVVKTLIAGLPELVHMYNSCFPHSNQGFTCFELLGFDVLLDENFRPWILEVNHSPSFNVDTHMDYRIKKTMLTEVLQLLQVDYTDRFRERQRDHDAFQARLEGRKVAFCDTEADMRRCARAHMDSEDRLAKGFRRIFPCDAKAELYDSFLESSFLVNGVAPTERQRSTHRELPNRALRGGTGADVRAASQRETQPAAARPGRQSCSSSTTHANLVAERWRAAFDKPARPVEKGGRVSPLGTTEAKKNRSGATPRSPNSGSRTRSHTAHPNPGVGWAKPLGPGLDYLDLVAGLDRITSPDRGPPVQQMKDLVPQYKSEGSPASSTHPSGRPHTQTAAKPSPGRSGQVTPKIRPQEAWAVPTVPTIAVAAAATAAAVSRSSSATADVVSPRPPVPPTSMPRLHSPRVETPVSSPPVAATSPSPAQQPPTEPVEFHSAAWGGGVLKQQMSAPSPTRPRSWAVPKATVQYCGVAKLILPGEARDSPEPYDLYFAPQQSPPPSYSGRPSPEWAQLCASWQSSVPTVAAEG